MQGRKGYFSSLVGRSIGKVAHAAMQPPKAGPWASLPSPEGDAFVERPQVPMTNWPDAFDGTPTQWPASNILPLAQQHSIATESQSFSLPLQVEMPKSIDPPHLHLPITQELTPPKPLPVTQPQPLSQRLEPEALLPDFAPVRKELAAAQLDSLDALLLSPEPLTQDSPEPNSQVRNPKKVPFMRILREVGMEEGLLEDLKFKNPIVGTKQMPQNLVASSLIPFQQGDGAQLPVSPLTPQKINSQKLESKALQQQETLRPASKEQRQTLAPSPRPMPAPITPQAPKSGLVIGKLTIEVIEAPKPAVVAQIATVPSPKPGRQAAPSHRPRTNLQYGLGQL